jgi:hypothetical protein
MSLLDLKHMVVKPEIKSSNIYLGDLLYQTLDADDAHSLLNTVVDTQTRLHDLMKLEDELDVNIYSFDSKKNKSMYDKAHSLGLTADYHTRKIDIDKPVHATNFQQKRTKKNTESDGAPEARPKKKKVPKSESDAAAPPKKKKVPEPESESGAVAPKKKKVPKSESESETKTKPVGLKKKRVGVVKCAQPKQPTPYVWKTSTYATQGSFSNIILPKLDSLDALSGMDPLEYDSIVYMYTLPDADQVVSSKPALLQVLRDKEYFQDRDISSDMVLLHNIIKVCNIPTKDT